MKNIFQLAAAFLLFSFSFQLWGQAGSLDSSFGLGGKIIADVPGGGKFVIQPDGKILVLGYIGGNFYFSGYYHKPATYKRDHGLYIWNKWPDGHRL